MYKNEREFYNAELKERFISEFTTGAVRRDAARLLFKVIARYEEKWNADFCTVGKEELQPVIDEMVGMRSTSNTLRLYILRGYVRWCIKNKVDGACDAIFSVEDTGIEKIRRQMVANPQHLQRYMNCIFDAESDETVCCVHRCFYWLAYGGMRKEDVINVRTSDVFLSDMVVRYDGEEYPIYREAIHAFKNCSELTRFRYKHPNVKKESYRERADGDSLLRGVGESKLFKSLCCEVSRKAANPKFSTKDDMSMEGLDLNLSFFRVQLSGIFYRKYELERAGVQIDFKDTAGWFMEGKDYKLDSGRNTPQAKQNQLAYDYKIDYIRWKEAYSI